MEPERWQQVETIFQAALKREPANRAVFLDGACLADGELRTEVESLLAAHEQAGSFINTPAVEMAAQLVTTDQADAVAGRSIGPYKIVARIGAGGMGEVYLAHDSRLGRQVALKLLPEYYTHDKDRLNRFKQEARAVSALNHPNIITIHEIGQADSTHFIATEYIEGQTLRQIIAQRSLRLTEVLDVAIQAASALATAHTAGIIHRDIKPENIMLRPDGYVKVLDFGLAKLTEQQLLVSAGASTVAKVSTDPGTVMGTASYMSPEQARGRAVDARTDIFSLGVVLYELLAGRAPFEGETTSDVIAAILEKQPPPLARYAPDLPTELQRIVLKALRKNADDRYQVSKEMLNDLRELKQELEVQARLGGRLAPGEMGVALDTDQRVEAKTGETETRTTSSAEVILSELKKHKTGAVVVFALLAIVIAALGIALYQFTLSKSSQSSGANQPGTASAAIKITPFPVNGLVGYAALSPDGKYFVHSLRDATGTGSSLWVRHLPTNSTVQILPHSKDFYGAAEFTQDSNYFYYIGSVNGAPPYTLNKLSVIGGTPKKLIADFRGTASFVISPDGRQIAFIQEEYPGGAFRLVVANEDGTGERVLNSHRGDEWFSGGLDWSPDGKTITYVVATTGVSGTSATFMSVQVEDGSKKEFHTGRWYETCCLRWLPDGSGLVFSGKESKTAPLQIWRVAYPSSTVRKLTNDLNDYYSRNITADGNTLLVSQRKSSSDIWIMPFGQGGDKLTQITFSKADEFGAWTPDGKMIFTSTASGNRNLWVMNADGSDRRQLTSGSDDRYPTISPDGRHIVFRSTRSGTFNLWRVDIDGSHLRQLTSQSNEDNLPRYTPDGKWVVFTSFRSGKGAIWKIPAEGGEAVQLTNKVAYWPVPSPDGKLVACNDLEAPPGRSRVLILPIEGGEPTQVVELPDNSPPPNAWTPDGRAIVYSHRHGDLWGIWKQPLAGGPPVLLTSWKNEPHGGRRYVPSPDGKQWAITRFDNSSDLVLISNFK